MHRLLLKKFKNFKISEKNRRSRLLLSSLLIPHLPYYSLTIYFKYCDDVYNNNNIPTPAKAFKELHGFSANIADRHPTYGKRRGAPTAPRRPYSLSLTTDWRNRSPTP